jgi:hypothetical protein
VFREKVQDAGQLPKFEQIAVAELKFAAGLSHDARHFLVDFFTMLPWLSMTPTVVFAVASSAFWTASLFVPAT